MNKQIMGAYLYATSTIGFRFTEWDNWTGIQHIYMSFEQCMDCFIGAIIWTILMQSYISPHVIDEEMIMKSQALDEVAKYCHGAIKLVIFYLWHQPFIKILISARNIQCPKCRNCHWLYCGQNVYSRWYCCWSNILFIFSLFARVYVLLMHCKQ